jgi:hypothetical protein
MKYVHLGCGLANRLFAMMRMMNRYKDITFIWEKLGNEYTSFDDLFETSLKIRIQNYSPTNTIVIHPWDYKSYREFNFTSKYRLKKSWKSDAVGLKTIGCCLCGRPLCVPEIARYIRPHESLRAELDVIKMKIQNMTALHIRDNPIEKGYSPKWKHIRRLLYLNYSYVAFENKHHLQYLHHVLKQEDVRKATRNRNTLQGLRSAVFDMYALSFASSIRSTKAFSTFHQMSACIKKSRLQ